jgi:hypothetical protein
MLRSPVVYPSPRSFVVLLFAFVATLPARPFAQARAASGVRPGVVEGRVVDAGTDDPLPGARMTVTADVALT